MKNISNKIRILHVDDEDDTLIVVKKILEIAGYEVTSVNRGEKALKKIKLDGYDLLILDILMPDMTGWDLFTKIMTIKPKYKVIFLSIVDMSQEKIKTLKDAGIVDYIKKPFDRNDLVNKVNNAIRTKNK